MLSIYASTLLILLASLLLGRAILGLAGWPGTPAWLSGAAGFAALVVLAPFLVRLPGRATTAAIVLAVLCVVAALRIARQRRDAPAERQWPVAVAVVAIVLLAASLPFLFNDRTGVLGEGIYTNDHAAQLYWADWLQHGFGPEPKAVRFGYPIGPQAVAVIAAQATGTSLVSSFNGLLLAIPALTGLTALGALARMPPVRRIAIAAACGLPYLAASFLAQSAFKETAMALFVLAFAIALASLGRERGGDARGVGPSLPAVAGIGLLLAAASVFTFSIPGLAWFAIAAVLWLGLEGAAGRSPVDWGRVRKTVVAHRAAAAISALALVAIAVVVIGPAIDFVGKINDVQVSAGRLSSPVFGGEALGIWPEGDFRIVRGEVTGALLAVALGAVAAGFGALALWRRRQFALLAMLIAGGVVYAGTRAFAEIHVQAKALAVIAPLVLLVGLRALLAPPRNLARYGLGALVLAAAAGSTLVALRAAPIGFDDRQLALERLAEEIDGKPVVFLGIDRFAGFYLRGTLARAPAGYVPEEIAARPEKTWQQGLAADFDTVDSGKLDKFDYAITTTAAYASTPPPNFERIDTDGDYALWKRTGPTPPSRVLDEGGNPGMRLDCDTPDGLRLSRRRGRATAFAPPPSVARYPSWQTPAPAEPAAGGQERGFDAPGTASTTVPNLLPGHYALSLQYHSQVPLEVVYEGEAIAELPPSLDGMYLSGAGRGAFWPAGEVEKKGLLGGAEVDIRAAAPTGLQDALGVPRRVWLGDLAATREHPAITTDIDRACLLYVDHFTLEKRGKA